MKITKYLFFLLLGSLFMLSSCKTEFEKVRSSADSELIYKKAMEFYDKEEFLKAQTLFELIVGSYRGRKEAEDIYYRYAYSHYHLRKYILASYYFKNFTNTFSTSKYREESDFMIAKSFYQLSPKYRLDQSYTGKAIEAFQIYVNTYPDNERVKACNTYIDELRLKLEQKAFTQAELYFNLKQYQAAMRSFTNVLAEFPETNDAEKIRYMLTRSSFLLANNSIDDKQEERFSETLEFHKTFVSKYPESEYSKEINSIYAISTNKLKEISNDRY